MTIPLAIFLYLMVIAFVSLSMVYYFKVIRPKDEAQLIQQQRGKVQ
jgi:hypothetical protein